MVETIEVRGHELQVGMKLLYGPKVRTVVSLTKQRTKWFLDGPPQTLDTMKADLDGLTITVFPSDHLKRVVEPNEQAALL
jgi:hypothetical protein